MVTPYQENNGDTISLFPLCFGARHYLELTFVSVHGVPDPVLEIDTEYTIYQVNAINPVLYFHLLELQ